MPNPTINNESQFVPKYVQTNIISTTPGTPTNIDASFKDQLGNLASTLAVQTLGSYTGFPQVIALDVSEPKYATLPLEDLSKGISGRDSAVGFQYTDFRAKISYKNLLAKRFDGASALSRKGWIGGLYAAASATPFGAYSIFNLNGNKYFGAGMGDHSNPNSIINDFTLRSHVATSWRKGLIGDDTEVKWRPSLNPLDLVVPFRGDRVTVIDFGQRLESNAYAWNPAVAGLENILGAANVPGLSQDFIKFYFTGPILHNGYVDDKTDDIIVFRALLSSLSDSYQANWTPQSMVGRADPNYQYTGFGRDLNLDFDIYATDRDEVKPIWRKLNALAGYTAPIYDETTIGLKAPWLRFTLGDLFHQQPVIITSLTYTLHDSDTTWEINIEQDPEMMQVPHKISVSMGLTMISDFLPQKGGRFYSLAKRYDGAGTPGRGSDNWLSDFKDNTDIIKTKRERAEKTEKPGKAKGRGESTDKKANDESQFLQFPDGTKVPINKLPDINKFLGR